MSVAPTTSDFDRWRQNYATMSDDDRRAWDARCYQFWPEQVHGSYDAIRDFVALGGRVVEVGGWRGDHASMMLTAFPAATIRSWTNIEFCRQAANAPKTTDPRYSVVVPDTFRWWQNELTTLPPADLLVLSHVIEHLSPNDLEGLLEAASFIPAVYAEAPLPEKGTDWQGYLGTHILPIGWPEVERMFGEFGYAVQSRSGDARVFKYGEAK